MSKKYCHDDWKDDNWDDSEVIDKLPLKEVIQAYREAGENEMLIYGWCVWRRELQKYMDLKEAMGPAWRAEHCDQINCNLEYDIMKDCREHGLMDIWLQRQKCEKPYRHNFDTIEEDIEYAYKSVGSIKEEESVKNNIKALRILYAVEFKKEADYFEELAEKEAQEEKEKREQAEKQTEAEVKKEKRKGFFHRR